MYSFNFYSFDISRAQLHFLDDSLSLFFSRRFFFLVSVSVRMSAISSESLRFIGHFEPKKVLV